MKIRLAVAVILVVCASAEVAEAGAVAGGATEFTQVLNNVELAAQVYQQVKTYQNLYQQLKILSSNDRLLKGHHFSTTAQPLLSELHRALVTDRTVSYAASSLNEEFERQYPGYRKYAHDTYGIATPTNQTWLAYDEQSQANVQSALATINLNRDQVLTEGQMLDLIARQATSTASKKAILQIGNDLALTQLNQSRRMENLLQTQISLQANYLAAEQGRRTRDQAASQDHWQREKDYLNMMKKKFDEMPVYQKRSN